MPLFIWQHAIWNGHRSIASILNAEGSNANCVFDDATKPETFSSMVKDVMKGAGRIDMLVNNLSTSNPGKDLNFANTIL